MAAIQLVVHLASSTAAGSCDEVPPVWIRAGHLRPRSVQAMMTVVLGVNEIVKSAEQRSQ